MTAHRPTPAEVLRKAADIRAKLAGSSDLDALYEAVILLVPEAQEAWVAAWKELCDFNRAHPTSPIRPRGERLRLCAASLDAAVSPCQPEPEKET